MGGGGDLNLEAERGIRREWTALTLRIVLILFREKGTIPMNRCGGMKKLQAEV